MPDIFKPEIIKAQATLTKYPKNVNARLQGEGEDLMKAMAYGMAVVAHGIREQEGASITSMMAKFNMYFDGYLREIIRKGVNHAGPSEIR